MIGTVGRVQVFAYCEPADRREGFEGLCGLVREAMQADPLSGAIFLFVNRRRTHAKVLQFDGTGLCVLAKRLGQGRFVALWEVAKHPTLRLQRSELELFLQGSHLIGRFKLASDELSNKDLAVGA